MANACKTLHPGETVIGFMTRDGKLVGQFAEPRFGHDQLADQYPGIRSRIQSGQVVAISVHKTRSGVIRAFGSGTFPPPGGTLEGYLRKFAEALVQ